MQNERAKGKCFDQPVLFGPQSNHFSLMNIRVNYIHQIFLELNYI